MESRSFIRTYRWRIALVLALVVLAAGTAGILWTARYMRSDAFREELGMLVQNASGRTVSIDGKLEVSVFPWLGLTAHGLVLGNAEGFDPSPMLRANSIEARVRVLPLLSHHLVFDTVELRDIVLELAVLPDGRNNWSSLIERYRAEEKSQGSSDALFTKVSLRGIHISGGSARLNDEKHNQELRLSNLNLRTGVIETGKAMPFTLQNDIVWTRPGLSGHVQLSGKLEPASVQATSLLSETTFQAELGGPFLPKNAAQAGVTGSLELLDGNRHLRLSNMRIKALGVDGTGELTFLDFKDDFIMRGRVKAERFSPRVLLNAYWPQAVSMAHQGALKSAEGVVELLANTEKLEFRDANFAVDDAHVRGSAVLGFGEKPGLDFDLKVDKLNVDAYAAALHSNSTDKPLVVDDLPMRYLSSVVGRGEVRADILTLAGVPAQSVLLEWSAKDGLHKLGVKPAKSQGGVVSGDVAVQFAEGNSKGGGMSPVLGITSSLSMNGVDTRQIAWANPQGFALTGRANVLAKASLPKTPLSPTTKLGQVLRKLSGSVQVGLTQAKLDWAATPARAGKAAEPAQRMILSSLNAQVKLTPAAAPGDSWAAQADMSLSATGTHPVLQLDGKATALVRTGLRGNGVNFQNGSVSGRLKGWFLPTHENEASFTGKGSLDVASQTLNMTGSSVQIYGLNLVGPLTVKKLFGSDFVITGRVRSQESDPRRLFSALEFRQPKSSDKRALTKLSGDTDLNLTLKGFQLTNINAQLDDTPVHGSYALADYDNPRQSFNLQAGNFDLDRYIAAPVPAAEAAKRPTPAPEPLPLDTLRSLNMEGTAQFRQFKYHGLTTRNFTATAKARDGHLLIKPMGGRFYGGDISGEISAQAMPQAMQVRLSLAAKGAALSPLMIGWAGKEYATGRADFFLDVAGQGATDQEVFRSMDGNAGFKVTDGSYVLSGAQERSSQRRGAGVQAPSKRPGTSFQQASARFRVRRGVFQSDDFRMDTQNMLVTGRGVLSVPDETIDFAMTANITGLPDVPVRVRGRLRDPEVNIPPALMINNTIKEVLGLPFKPFKFFKDLLF